MQRTFQSMHRHTHRLTTDDDGDKSAIAKKWLAIFNLLYILLLNIAFFIESSSAQKKMSTREF